eukprot:scaffold118224_cov58-Attheya_sp.AAC.2
MALELRPYQVECLAHAKEKNTIVSLPTGVGKTLIAAQLIDHYLKESPDKKIAFLVPTRPLVDQQAQYCIKHVSEARNLVVERLIGDEKSSWTQSDWNSCIARCNLLLGTAALFQQLFVTDKYVNINQFSLIVLDECHNAVGNSPMASLMRDGVAPNISSENLGPRILGLTASIINGNLKNMERKRKTLEALLQSTIICPIIESNLTINDFTTVPWEPSRDQKQKIEAIDKHVKEALNNIGGIKEIQKLVNKCSHVFKELGQVAMGHYLDIVIVQQVLEKAVSLDQNRDELASRYAKSLREGVPSLRIVLDKLTQELKSLSTSTQLGDDNSNKLDALLKLLKNNFEAHSNTCTTYCGIIFVQQVSLVSPTAKRINVYFNNEEFCGVVAGTGCQSESERQRHMDAFRLGKSKILVATAALEEGIDVPECAFVIRYNSVATTKAHIQGTGRARHPNAKIFYFENNPEVERKKEEAMLGVARNASLTLSQDELDSAREKMSVPIVERHPYPFFASASDEATRDDHGEVNVFNCKQIFNQYCSITLGRSISPKTVLYEYASSPGNERKMIKNIRCPTPSGWKEMTDDFYRTFWSGVDIGKIFHEDRAKTKTTSEKEEMCFVYLVVVQLREGELLDRHNKPVSDLDLRDEIKRNCPLEPPNSSDCMISLKDKVTHNLNI